MSTQKETVEFILEQLGNSKYFSVRTMFGEYALYADGKVVALICDNLLHIKIMLASQELEGVCEKSAPYPGAKLHYVVAEEQLARVANLSSILLNMARELPEKKQKKK